MALEIYIVEANNAESFKIYDRTVWTSYDYSKVTAATLTVVYGGNTYTQDVLDLLPGGPTLGGVTSVNLVGTSVNSYLEITPSKLLDGSTPLAEVYFPDGYYEITLSVTYTGIGDMEDTSTQGFLSETYQMASQLPLQIDLNNFNYNENRLQFLCIALLQSCKWAGELGRETQFTSFTTKVNDFLDARSISKTWSL